MTWALALREVPEGTRLVVRARAARGYSVKGLPEWISSGAIGGVNFIMQRKQLLGLAARVEGRLVNRGRTATHPILVVMAAGVGIAALAWTTYASAAWLRFGRPARPTRNEADALLDTFMPEYDVVDRHRGHVEASPADTLAAACAVPLFDIPVVGAIFRAREWLLGSSAHRRDTGKGLLDLTRSLGWVMLAERPGREIVMGAVTRPWEADVTFRSIPPDAFAAFDESGYVKIAWTLRADPVGDGTTIFRTETRAVATDTMARARFRRYWAWLSPGIRLIRPLMLRRVTREARERAVSPSRHDGAAGQ